MNQRLDELLQSCTVKLTVPNKVGWGTGFFVARGLILTCAHVVKGVKLGSKVQISIQGRKSFSEATLDSLPPDYDLALLSFSPSPIDNSFCVYLAPEFEPFDRLYTFGYSDQFPDGTSVTSECEGTAFEKGQSLILFKSGQIRPGISGSPLLNKRTGSVCGIVKFTRDRTTDLGGGAIPTQEILEQFPQLKGLQQKFHQQDRRWIDVSKPISIPYNLPRSGTVEFVGRDEVMAKLHQMLQRDSPGAVSTISGMGGIGKTELALQYALRYRGEYPGGICWLQIRGMDLGTQIIEFGRALFSDFNPPNELDLKGQVKYCWGHWPQGKALIILDDVPDDYYNKEKVRPYLPVAEPRFKVLMTSRMSLGPKAWRIDLDVLSPGTALELLRSLAGNERINAEIETAETLCEWLDYLPLGLELVGYYLDEHPTLKIEAVLVQLKSKRLAAQALCQQQTVTTAKLGVAATFELSWEKLTKEAKHLGCRLSLFSPTPFEWKLVEACGQPQESGFWGQVGNVFNRLLNRTVETNSKEKWSEIRDNQLLKQHLLQLMKQKTYRMHPLLREFFLTKLSELPEADKYRHAMVTVAKSVEAEVREKVVESLLYLHTDEPATATNLIKELLKMKSEEARQAGLKAAYYIGRSRGARDIFLWAAINGESELRQTVKNTLYLIWRNESDFVYSLLKELVEQIKFSTLPYLRNIVEFVIELPVTIYINHCEQEEIVEQITELHSRMIKEKLHLDLFNTGILEPIFGKLISQVVTNAFSKPIIETTLFNEFESAKHFFSLAKEDRACLKRIVLFLDPKTNLATAQDELAVMLKSNIMTFNLLAAEVLAVHSCSDFQKNKSLIQILFDKLEAKSRLWLLLSFNVLLPNTPPDWVELLEDFTRRLIEENPGIFYGKEASWLEQFDIMLLPLGLAYGKQVRAMPYVEALIQEGLICGNQLQVKRCIAGLGAVGFYYPEMVFRTLKKTLPDPNALDLRDDLIQTLATIRTRHLDSVDIFLSQIGADATFRHQVSVSTDIELVRRYIFWLGLFNHGVHSAVHYPKLRQQMIEATLILADARSLREAVTRYTLTVIRVARQANYRLSEWTRLEEHSSR